MAEVKNQPRQPDTARGTSLLSALGLDAEKVLQAPNVQQTLTSPVQPTSDALGIFTGQEQAAGVPKLQEAFQTAQKNFLEAQNLASQQQLTLQGRRKKLGVMRGEQAQAAGQAQQELGVLQTGMTLAQSALQSAQATAAQRANILYQDYQKKLDINLQFPGIDINPLTDDYQTVGKKLEEFKKDEAKKAEKDAYKQALREMGLKTKGSRKQLEKRLRKANKEAAKDIKKENELKLQALEIQVAAARKSLQEKSETTASQLDSIYGTTGGQSTETTDDYSSIFNSLGYNFK